MNYNTEILTADSSSIRKAAGLIKNGEVVGMPTETVYGLAANALDESAVAKIFIAKGRPQDNPLIVHISCMEMLDGLVTAVPETAVKCAERFWPGPLTMILPKTEKIPSATSAGLDTVGIRMPSNKTARALIDACGLPLAAPSANLSGSPSPTSALHVYDDMNGRIPCILDDGRCAVGVESTVISFEDDAVRLLRPGFISVSDLKEVTENVIVDKGVLDAVSQNAVVASPGMKYKHYSPNADVIIIDGSLDSFRKYVSENSGGNTWCMTFSESDLSGIDCPSVVYGSSDKEQARRIFDALRELDKNGADKVFARCPQKAGVGLAVYNRLLRAAGFQVIRL
ncbi:L-threonylcarbamoyladenylate synthase [Ruminococcus sp. Marseille-P6503]|uniref:L-threonylcarbamoyladenylate synthase n=1 Tax=Ruminococcus sp. Marseille-P6503 TaxID=2364796 RepID=UPI000F533016|nr:L-threonylcarbamoyladenylate synthase [Ruminococcus sp. Marseille-P6503]